MKYYHGTNEIGLVNILVDGFIGVEYSDIKDFGFFVTTDFLHALNHGQYVIEINDIDNSMLSSDGINDGLFHRGKHLIYNYSIVIANPDSRTDPYFIEQLIITDKQNVDIINVQNK